MVFMAELRKTNGSVNSSIENLYGGLERVFKAIWGNGREGILERLTKIETQNKIIIALLIILILQKLVKLWL